MQSPIANYCLKVSIYDHYEPQLVTNVLLQVSVRELHNSILIPPEEGVIKEEIDADNNIIISYSTLQSIPPTQHKKMYAWYKVMCDCECFIYAKLFIQHCYHGVIVI